MSDPLELTPVQRLVLAFWALFAVLFRPDVARAVHMLRVTQGAQGLPPRPAAPEPWHAAPPPVATPPVAPPAPMPTPPERVAAPPPTVAAPSSTRTPAPEPAKPGAVGPIPPPAAAAPPAKPAAAEKVQPERPAAAAVRAPEPPRADPRAAALQLLAALQREGRLVDFLEEDLTGFPDASIGAAARTVHAGCKRAIEAMFQLEPVFREAEGARVTVAAGFDAGAIRLSGNVVGQPPFQGALRHHGWRAREVKLPPPPDGKDLTVVAPAEIEL
ncbi:conserved hypothetical protein [Anaeromyxobacter dehalogenans 2CP-1]|uniref:DUF2760 domain-containing protein n=1 Tax=Anaeromyxobacter dehalogenans (strain ATCC BAA-258 / DSM 21875 / 2CP-1) TaxID=455488 RepID=B8JGT0_ANAD2|nr:DUF2760 domain-containing protein [Anaeromyxobacter dehalogenans]ACL66567.1 conserved hypothetical protein [Anaeromyxobacter dehalogenans 2CP-1]